MFDLIPTIPLQGGRDAAWWLCRSTSADLSYWTGGKDEKHQLLRSKEYCIRWSRGVFGAGSFTGKCSMKKWPASLGFRWEWNLHNARSVHRRANRSNLWASIPSFAEAQTPEDLSNSAWWWPETASVLLLSVLYIGTDRQGIWYKQNGDFKTAAENIWPPAESHGRWGSVFFVNFSRNPVYKSSARVL